MQRAWLAAAVLGAAADCSHPLRPTADANASRTLLTLDQENELGEQLRSALETRGVKLASAASVTGYVTRLTALTASGCGERNFELHVHVVDAPGAVNAFSTSGGHLYVTTGLLLAAANESELMGVLGHELGHLQARDMTRHLVAHYGLQMVANVALGRSPELLNDIAVALLTDAPEVANDLDDELAADVYAMRCSAAAGYDPRGIALFFGKLPSREGSFGPSRRYLHTHPTSHARLEHINAVIAREHLAGARLGAEPLAALKQRLQNEAGVTKR
jgi:predicted Zn-dependent protease